MTTTAPVPEIQVADVDQETAKEATEEEVGVGLLVFVTYGCLLLGGECRMTLTYGTWRCVFTITH